MNKAIHIGLSVAATELLVTVIARPQIVDSMVLLESRYPGYADWIMRARSAYQNEGTDGTSCKL